MTSAILFLFTSSNMQKLNLKPWDPLVFAYPSSPAPSSASQLGRLVSSLPRISIDRKSGFSRTRFVTPTSAFFTSFDNSDSSVLLSCELGSPTNIIKATHRKATITRKRKWVDCFFDVIPTRILNRQRTGMIFVIRKNLLGP